jgi:hypothetical protein
MRFLGIEVNRDWPNCEHGLLLECLNVDRRPSSAFGLQHHGYVDPASPAKHNIGRIQTEAIALEVVWLANGKYGTRRRIRKRPGPMLSTESA